MRIWIIAAALMGALLATGPAAAQTPPGPGSPTKTLAETLTGEARADYEGAKILFQARDFAAALVKFEHAYSLSKDPRLLWNAAICQKELRRYTRMLATIERLLKEGGPLLSEKDRQDAAAIVQTVQAFISPLKLDANEAGASVFVDGEDVGTTPLQKRVPLDVGTRTIRISKPGYKQVDRTVTVVGGNQEVAISVTLRKEIHRGQLSVTAGPDDLISLDGFMVAKGKYDDSVPSGGHTLLVTSPGMIPYQSEVVVQDNKSRSIPVTLNPQPAPSDPSKWLWLAGGAAIVAGVITAGVILAPTNEGIPGTINMQPIPLHFGGFR